MAETISEQDVRHVAKLARLNLSDDQVHHFRDQLADVLDYIGKLNELDIEGVEPMARPFDTANALRDDEPRPGLSVDAALANAPARDGAFFKVPKVLGDGGGA